MNHSDWCHKQNTPLINSVGVVVGLCATSSHIKKYRSSSISVGVLLEE